MKKKRAYDYARFGYIFSIPFVLAWLVFQLYPIFYTLLLGFTDLKGAGNTDFNIMWSEPFKNFITVLKNKSFKVAFGNTLVIWGLNFIPQILLALLIAAWFTNRRSTIKAQGIFKVLFYLPNIITQATVAMLFAQLFLYPKGVINDLLITLKIFKGPVEMMRNANLTRGVVIFIQTWMWYGYTAIVLISGVLGISPELFEAAEVDGANQWQTFFRVTIPSIKTMLLFTLVTSLIGGLNMFDIPKLFQDGGPNNATLTTSLYIYRKAFQGGYLYGEASAASMIMFFIIVFLSCIVFYLLRDKDEVELRRLVRKQEKEYRRKMKMSKM
ncbi:MAG: sugar ABC transporter permease [Lachnospiraceae bacterium]|nr:sugar ABC transporter permease [Lachnospiraceae bacterium]